MVAKVVGRIASLYRVELDCEAGIIVAAVDETGTQLRDVHPRWTPSTEAWLAISMAIEDEKGRTGG